MDQYLNFSNNHPLEHNRGVERTLMNRADRLKSDETELGREKEHIRKTLQLNGYLDWGQISSTKDRKWGNRRKRRGRRKKWSRECQPPP